MSFASMVWVPLYAIYYVITQPGSLKERIQKGLTEDIKLRPEAASQQKTNLIEGFKPKIKRMQNLAAPKTIHISESGVGLLTHNTSEYEMGRLHRPESFVTPSNENQN